MSHPFKSYPLAMFGISSYQNTLIDAIDGIRFMAQDYWRIVGIIPSLQGDYGAFLEYVDLNQQAIALWLEFYLLNNQDAVRLCKSDPSVSAAKREADLYLSWFKLAQQMVAAPKFDQALRVCIKKLDSNIPIHDPAFWMVWAASASFETKMKNAGFHQFLKLNPVEARVTGSRKRYQKAVETFNNSDLSTLDDWVQGQKEGSGLDSLYQIASWLNQHDSAFEEDNFTSAMKDWRRYNEQGYRLGAKAAYLEKSGSLNVLGEGTVKGIRRKAKS